jgi:hypothetical protein
VRRAGKLSADIELAGGDVIYDVPVSGVVKAQQRVQVLNENGRNTILGAAKEGGTSSTVYKASGVFSGAPSVHALNGPNHTGTLAQSQAPWALAADGSVTLVGNLDVQAGVTVDGVDISAFKAAYDAHNHDTRYDARYLQLTGGALSGAIYSNPYSPGSEGWSIGTDGSTELNALNLRNIITSVPFTSGEEGWQIDVAGIGEMDSLTLRSSLHAQSFVTDLMSAHIGDDIHAKSAGTLHAEMVVPASGTWTMMIDDAPGTNALLFDLGDIIQAKLAIGGAIGETWFTVGSGTSNGDGTQSYTCTRQSGDVSVTYGAGAGVVDWGVANQGILLSSTRGTYGPYFDVRTHAGVPWTTQTTRLRIGNLRGWDGIASNRYGIGIGDYAAGSYLKYEPGMGLVVKGGGGHVSIEPNGIAVATSSSTSDYTAAYVFGSLAGPSGYLKYYTDDIGSGYPKWLDIHHQSNTSGGVRIVADGTSGYSGKQTSAVLHTSAFEVGDSYASVAGVYAWTNRFIHLASDGMVVDVGLNLGTATGAASGQINASGGIRATGAGTLTGGPGIELFYGPNGAQINGFDRDSASYKQLAFDASSYLWMLNGTSKLTLDAAGSMKAVGEIFPSGFGNGIANRLSNCVNTQQLHFNGANTIPSGYTWAGTPFTTPTSLIYNFASDYLYTYLPNTTDRAFMYRGVVNSTDAWRGKTIIARVRCGQGGTEAGIRVDSNNDTNYAELVLQGQAGTMYSHLVLRTCVGGTVTVVTANMFRPTDQFATIALLCYWTGSAYVWYGYLVSEEGVSNNAPLTASATWMPTIGRCGFVTRGSGNPCSWDWFSAYFG